MSMNTKVLAVLVIVILIIGLTGIFFGFKLGEMNSAVLDLKNQLIKKEKDIQKQLETQTKIELPKIETKEEQKEEEAQPVNKKEKAEKGIAFVSNEFGFKIVFPKGWEEFRVMIERNADMHGLSYIHFLLPTTDKSWPTEENRVTGEKYPGFASAMAISIWEQELRNLEKESKGCKIEFNPGCPNEGQVVGQNEKYVFEASFGQALPQDAKFKSLIPGGSGGYIKSPVEFLKDKFEILN